MLGGLSAGQEKYAGGYLLVEKNMLGVFAGKGPYAGVGLSAGREKYAGGVCW